MLRSVYLLRCVGVNTYRKCIKTLCNESFHIRTLLFLRSTVQLQKPLPHTSEITNEYFENLLPRAQKTLESIYSDFKKLQSTSDEAQRNVILEDIDSKCFSIVHTLKPYQIFDLLYIFHQVYPQRIHTTLFYDKAISKLVEAVESSTSLNDKDIIQLLFFMSFNREIATCYINDIRSHLTDITKLSLFEKCVVADCFVKFDVKFTPFESEVFEKIINNEFEVLKKDSNLLMIVCKALTSISTKEVLNLESLTNAIVCTEEPWDFKILVNLLNLYSRALLFEPKVIDSLVKDGMKALKKDLKSNTPHLELYDINKFLLSSSSLGLTLTLDEKLILRSTVENRYNEYKQIKNLSFFVNSLLCLNILGCQTTKLLQNCFRDHVFEPIHQKSYLWRIESKLKLVSTLANLEMKLPIPKSLNRPIVSRFTPSSNIIELEEICKQLMDKKIVDSVKIECPVDALYLPGVTLTTENGVYHVDVLDNVTCLKKTNIPHGYMNLKIRLLPRLQIRHIMIQENLLQKPQQVLESITKKINYGRASTFRHMW